MGWVNSVDLIQNFIRRFVFQTCGVNPEFEVRADKGAPLSSAAVVCMDGFDLVTRLKTFRDILGAAQGHPAFSVDGKSLDMARFVMERRRRNLPLNVGKEVMQDFCATILCGELDGVAGILMHARDKGSRLASRTLAVFILEKAPQVTMQHWAGIFCFIASFRRPLFAVAQDQYEIFKFRFSQ